MSVTATINAKGTNGTGITEDLVKLLHDSLGKGIVAVVEIRSESRAEDLKGNEKVNLVIQTIEPAQDGEAEAYLRKFQRSLYQQRRVMSEGETLDIKTGDDLEPKVADVLAAGAALVPHDFEVDPDEPDKCTVCGGDDYADIHQTDQDDPEPDESQGDEEGADQDQDAGDPVPA